MNWFHLMFLLVIGIIIRFFYGQEIDTLSFYQTCVLGLIIIFIAFHMVLIFYVLKVLDNIKEIIKSKCENSINKL